MLVIPNIKAIEPIKEIIMADKKCIGIDCAWCASPECPNINKADNKQLRQKFGNKLRILGYQILKKHKMPIGEFPKIQDLIQEPGTKIENVIDGIDVSKCKHLYILNNIKRCDCSGLKSYCSYNNNCYYKELQRAIHKCEELENENEDYHLIESMMLKQYSLQDQENTLCANSVVSLSESIERDYYRQIIKSKDKILGKYKLSIHRIRDILRTLIGRTPHSVIREIQQIAQQCEVLNED